MTQVYLIEDQELIQLVCSTTSSTKTIRTSSTSFDGMYTCGPLLGKSLRNGPTSAPQLPFLDAACFLARFAPETSTSTLSGVQVELESQLAHEPVSGCATGSP